MAARARSEASREGSLLLSMPDQVIVHILLQLTDSSASHFARRDALSALAFMSTCRRMLQLVESNNAVWAAMVRAELFAPEPEEDGKLHSTRARFRQLRRLSLTGLWKVVGRYAAAGEYSYTMQLCDLPNSKIWDEFADEEDTWHITNPNLHAHYAVAGSPELPVQDAQRVDWVIGDVAGPWRMRILAKCTRNMIVFNECASDDTPHGRWVNLCSAVVSADGKRMEGIWMQTRDGRVIVSPSNSGTFEAVLFERPPEGVDHLAWYYAARDEQRRAWAGRVDGGLPYDEDGHVAAPQAEVEADEDGGEGVPVQGDGLPPQADVPEPE